MRSDRHQFLIERPRGAQRRKTHRGNKPRAREWLGEQSVARKHSLHSNELHDYGLKNDVDA